MHMMPKCTFDKVAINVCMYVRTCVTCSSHCAVLHACIYTSCIQYITYIIRTHPIIRNQTFVYSICTSETKQNQLLAISFLYLRNCTAPTHFFAIRLFCSRQQQQQQIKKTTTQTTSIKNTTTATITAITVTVFGGAKVAGGSLITSLPKMQMLLNRVPSFRCEAMVVWSFSPEAKLLVKCCAMSMVGTRGLVQFW